MNYGLYLSASGALTSMYRQDVFSNNLANVQTIAFKPDVPDTRQRKTAVREDGLSMDVSKQLLDRLGGGVLAGPQRINFTPGTLIPTGNPLDVAFEDKHSFFVIDAVDSQTGQKQAYLTRDGRFKTNAEGELVTQSGDVVRGTKGLSILIPPGSPVRISPDGEIIRQGEVLGQIMVTRVQDTSQMVKRGHNRFSVPPGYTIRQTDNPDMRGGFLEGSGVDPIATLMSIVNATKTATGNTRMIQYHDQLMDRAINTLGRVA